MKQTLFAAILTLLFFSSVGLGAEAHGDHPANVEIKEAVSAFHVHMEAVWHRAYPARDIEAIRARVPVLKEAADAIVLATKEEGSPEARAAAQALDQSVEGLEAAFQDGDQDAVLSATKLMHDRFHGVMESVDISEHEQH